MKSAIKFLIRANPLGQYHWWYQVTLGDVLAMDLDLFDEMYDELVTSYNATIAEMGSR